jgi:hypothetical protein
MVVFLLPAPDPPTTKGIEIFTSRHRPQRDFLGGRYGKRESL